MKNFSVFDILGPIMIGPSSSHTAGAARLAKISRIIAGSDIAKVNFVLHGSFAKTYKGHGTDKALVAGILGMDPWDKRLKTSFEIADENELYFEFSEDDLGEVHPNTVKFIITKKNGEIVNIIGSSIGGGNILILEIDGQPAKFTGDSPTLIITQNDTPGMISKVSSILYDSNINIAFLNVYRNSRGLQAVMVLETDSIVPMKLIDKIKSLNGILTIKEIKPITEGE